MLEVRLLGSFQIHCRKKPVRITSRPAQSLFAYLILHAGTAYRREKLAGQLWPDSREESARDYLRHALWRIRKALLEASAAVYLKADDLTVCFDASQEYWLDAAALLGLQEKDAPERLAEVLDAYAGELLPGFYEEWVVLERERLQATYEQQVARLLDMLQAQQCWRDVLRWAERWIALGQRPEAAYRYLMTAHAAEGDMAKAAAAFERCTKSLVELGMEPSEQTRQLYQELKTGRRVAVAVPAPHQGPAPREARSNLPAPLTSFIGREKELGDIMRLLKNQRLLTLVGPGGVGKTRLAIQAASSQIGRLKDGVVWIGLVGLFDESLIPQEIAQALHVREVPSEPLMETVVNYLKPKEILLVMDNCEHLIKGCAKYSEHLLTSCPSLRILASSIEGLGLFNETIWQVPSLPVPQSREPISLKKLREYESVRLFEERATQANPKFDVDEQNLRSVAEICRRLDGIPLAIELAAARTRVLSVQEIAGRLDDRFSLLTSGSRTAIPRHQTLRATIDWSYELLTEQERILFRRLSIFAGSFTLEGAESVCSLGELKPSEILHLLAHLADRSLVVVEPSAENSETRYRLLETIRQYGLERLATSGETREVRRLHAEYYARLAEAAEPSIFSSATAKWFRVFDRELDNIRSAAEWATTNGNAVLALRILGSLVQFWFNHGLLGSEWNDRVQQALQQPEGTERTLARAKALNGIGFMYWADIYPTDKRPELEEALSIGRELGDPWTIATALHNLGLMAYIQGEYSAARSLLEQSQSVWRELGARGKFGRGMALSFLGDVALNQDELQRARSLYEEAITVLRDSGDLNFQPYTIRRLGHVAWLQGDYGRAFDLCKESLELNREVSDPRGILACLAGFAAIAVERREYERAAVLAACVETRLAAFGNRLLYMDRLEYERNLGRLRSALDAKTLARLWSKGSKMTMDQAMNLALARS